MGSDLRCAMVQQQSQMFLRQLLRIWPPQAKDRAYVSEAVFEVVTALGSQDGGEQFEIQIVWIQEIDVLPVRNNIFLDQ